MAVASQQAAIERTRRGYKAFDEGDVNTVLELFDANIKWHVGGQSRYAGDYDGRDAVFAFFGRLMQDGLQQKHEIHDILASDEHVVVLANVTMTYGGKTLVGQVVDIAHENADGKTTEFWRIAADQKAFDDLVGG